MEKQQKKRISLADHFTYTRLLRFVLPSVVMMVFTSIYGVVDGLFVSNFAGKTSFAAINFIMPFVQVLGGLGFMIGTGGSALVTMTLGQGDRKRANRYFTMMIYLTVLLGVFVTVIGIVFTRKIAVALGASDAMIGECVLYGRITIAFTVFFMLQNVFQSFLVAAEKPHLGLRVTIRAGVMNMVLDALLVGVIPWGVAGAAIATGISEFTGGIVPLVYFLKKNDSLLNLTETRLELRPILKACGNGSSELMTNIAASIVGMLYNYQLMKYLGEDGVSAYGVIMYVGFIFVAIFFGYAVGSAPIIGFHYGAQNHDELKNMFKKSLMIVLCTGLAMMVLAEAFAPLLAKIFVGYDKELCLLTQHGFRIYSFSFLLCGITIFASSFFTALSNGVVSATISFLRSLIFQTTCVMLLPVIIGVDGIWWAVITAEIFSCIVSIAFFAAKRKEYHYL